MEFTYDNMVKFMDNYFQDYNQNAGNPQTLPKMRKYYTPAVQLFSYTLNSQMPHNQDRILQSMLHPGLHEEFTPHYYVVDVKRRAVVVQMQNQFTEESINKSYPSKQLSVHYYLAHDNNKEFKINKILFFVEARPVGEEKMADLIKKYQKNLSPDEKKQFKLN